MALRVNLTELEQRAVGLRGEVSAREMQLEGMDELIAVEGPLHYDLEVEKVAGDLVVRGSLSLELRCECVRCLQPFSKELRWDPYELLLPLTGEDRVPRHQDWVDLTPPIREDILLGFPQHPVCGPDCRGIPLPASKSGKPEKRDPKDTNPEASAWSELNKLKL